MTTCIFCASEDASGEARVWPAWVESHAALGASARGADPEHWVAPAPGRLVSGICEGCASGWIETLGNTAMPLLGAMLAGETVSLTEDDQRMLSAWALTEAIMCALAGTSPPLFPGEHLEALHLSAAANPVAPEGVSVDLFRYRGERWSAFHRAYPLMLAFGGADGPPDTPAYGITFTLGSVGFHVFGVTLADLKIDRRDSPLGRRMVRQIWPYRRQLVWPLTPALDDEQLITLADSFAG